MGNTLILDAFNHQVELEPIPFANDSHLIYLTHDEPITTTTSTTSTPTTTTTTTFIWVPSYAGPSAAAYIQCPISGFTGKTYFQINGSGFSFFGYSGNSWSTLTITAFNINDDGDGYSQFELRDGNTAITNGDLPYTIDISSYTSGQYSTINYYYNDVNNVTCSVGQRASMTFYVKDIYNVQGLNITSRISYLGSWPLTTTTTTTI